jgi:hypothetical protein
LAAGRQIAVFTVSAIVFFTSRSLFDAIFTQLIQSLILAVNFSKVSNLITAGLCVVHFLISGLRRDFIGKASQWTGEQLLTCIDVPCFVNTPMKAFEKKMECLLLRILT